MAACNLKLSIDGDGFARMLSSLTEIANRFPEFRDGILSLLNSGDELFIIDRDIRTASGTGELVVGFKPSDSLLGLMSAFRARNPDFVIFKHDEPPKIS